MHTVKRYSNIHLQLNQINGQKVVTLSVTQRCEYKKRQICEKDHIWNPATCSCGNGKYLTSVIDDTAIKCDNIIDADTEKKLFQKI